MFLFVSFRAGKNDETRVSFFVSVFCFFSLLFSIFAALSRSTHADATRVSLSFLRAFQIKKREEGVTKDKQGNKFMTKK